MISQNEQPLAKRKPLDWHAIADAAIALADEVGLERVSLRAVAERLTVTPMALYKHISDKAELDAIVSAEVLRRSMRELTFTPDAPWREVLREAAVEMHRAFELRPQMLHIFIQYPFYPKSQRLRTQIISALVRAGVGPSRACKLFSMISMAVVGEILSHHHYARGRTSAGFERAQREEYPDADSEQPGFPVGMMNFSEMLELQLDLIGLEVARLAAEPHFEAGTKN